MNTKTLLKQILMLMIILLIISILIWTIYFNKIDEKRKVCRNKYSIEYQNEQRWKQLQYNYRFINLTLLTNPTIEKGKSIIYQCSSVCGGLGDRFRGILMCYLLSILLNRQLVIDMDEPCPFTNYFQPNKYQWISGSDYKIRGSFRYIQSIDHNIQLADELKTKPFHQTWSDYDNIELLINIDFFQEIFSNEHLKSHPIIEMFLKEMPNGEANFQTLFPLFFEILFKPTRIIVKVIDRLLENRSIEHLVCAHLRIGENPSNPRDSRFSYRDQIADTFIRFLLKYQFLENNSLLSFFITSDSFNATNQILQSFPNISFSIPGPILHIDLPTKVDCYQGFAKVVADFYLLSECQTVILTNSGFSTYANRRRFNPYLNLFKYNEKKNQVEKCIDLRSTKGWEPKQNQCKLFCPVITDNNYINYI